MIQHFSLSENVAWQRFVKQIVTFLKIFQGFSLFSYQCSLAVLCCISQRQLVYNSTSVIFCQQLFSSFSEIFLRSSTQKPSSCISVSIRCLPSHQRQLCYTIMSRMFCQQLFYLFFNFILSHKIIYVTQKNTYFRCFSNRGWENRTPTKGFGDPYHTIWPIPYIQKKFNTFRSVKFSRYLYFVPSEFHTESY